MAIVDVSNCVFYKRDSMSLHIDCEMIVHLFSKLFYFLKFSNHFISATIIFFLICLQICIHNGKLLFVWIVSVFCLSSLFSHTHMHRLSLQCIISAILSAAQQCLCLGILCGISPLPRYYRELGPRPRSTTVKLVPIPAVLP